MASQVEVVLAALGFGAFDRRQSEGMDVEYPTEVPMVEETLPPSTTTPSIETSIGIDLGTSTSSVAIWRNGGVEVLSTDEQGRKSLPSHVLFGEKTVSIPNVGGATEDELWSGRAIFNVKRLIGRTDLDPVVQSCTQTYPFLVESLGLGIRTSLGALCNDVWRSTTPEDVVALQLMKLRTIAEAEMGRVARSAVITVPVSFSRFQLTRLERACALAGIIAPRFMPEPTATALLYAQVVQQQHTTIDTVGDRVAFIFNMGAGYCDAAVTTTAGGVSLVRGLAGEPFGGEELLQNLVNYLVTEMLPQLGSSPSKQNVQVATGRLRYAAERAMHELSTQLDAVVQVELGNGAVFTRNVTRHAFEDVNAEVFQRCLNLIVGCMRDAEMEPETVSDVIVVGGASNVAAVRDLLRKVFGSRKEVLFWEHGSNPIGTLDHREAAVRGAALEGAIMSGSSLELLTIQAIPQTVGVSLQGGKFHRIVQKNSTIPSRKDVVLSTSHDNQREVLISVYEGESDDLKNNHLLGFFKLSELPSVAKGETLVRLCVDVDAANVVRVVACAYLASSGAAVGVGIREVRMPTVDDGQGWCVEALHKKFGDTMDVCLME